jgi:hypothetical protein
MVVVVASAAMNLNSILVTISTLRRRSLSMRKLQGGSRKPGTNSH